MARISTEKELREFVSEFKWTFAKTYAKTAPHEYIVLDKVGIEHKAEFAAVARFIREAGFEAYYYRRKGYYFILDDNYYWTMDEKIEDTDLINRARLSDYELVDNAWRWKGSR
ncbi:MAG: hypothetical protein GX465_12535 [Acidobacteria bacterium]|nr:hypothetical protein [Acidobacteriota bacterium]